MGCAENEEVGSHQVMQCAHCVGFKLQMQWIYLSTMEKPQSDNTHEYTVCFVENGLEEVADQLQCCYNNSDK